MTEYDVSLLFFDNSIFLDVEKNIGHIPTDKKWQGESCVEVFCEKSIGVQNLSFLIEAFLQEPLTIDLLKLRGRKALHIGVFFDTANCNFDLKLPALAQLQQHNLEVIVSCYPHD